MTEGKLRGVVDGAATADAAPFDAAAEGLESACDARRAGAEATEEAARDLAERNALALAFDDVRAESREGRLVSPGRWAELGLVPDHLTDEDFEMLVFERWEDDERAREEAEAKNPAPPARAYRTATRAVGVPPLIGRAADDSASASVSASAPASSLEGAASTEPGDEAAAAAAPESAASSAPDASETTTGVSDAPGESAFADAGALAASDDENPFSGLDIPAGFELVQLEGEWCLVETGEQPEPVELEVNTEGIKALIGSRSYYLYDSLQMTDVYARWAYLAAEDDPQVTFAECVRQESRVYPRPMPLESLRNAPFRMSVDEIESTWRAVHDSGAYPDLERVVASNGDMYFFSTDHLSRVRAAALAEWDAVERYRNV